MKRWVSWVLALAMVTMTLLPASAEAIPQSATPETAVTQEVQTEDDQEAITGTYGVLRYTVNDDGTSCSITDCDTSAKGELEIPEEIDGYKVTTIGNSAFENCGSLTSITIPESVTSIEDFAFSCTSLTSITIPESVTSIGDGAFEYTSLTSITIPESVTTIGDSVFKSCDSLASITIPGSVTTIGNSAFESCSSLTSITIPKGVTNMGDRIFYCCSSLMSITIAEGVKSIKSKAFFGCSSLTSITIPEGVGSIGEGAFFNCTSLTSITIPESVSSIYEAAFRNCKSLTSIAIPKGVSRITESAFMECSSLTSIIIPESVTWIEGHAFEDCSLLTNITIPAGVRGIGASAFRNCSSLTTHIVIPTGVKAISDHAFSGCSSLTSITIPEGVTRIADYAFYSCKSLTSITIPESVTSIGEDALRGCSSLTSITIPEGITIIEEGVFEDCNSLTRITIPEGVTVINNYAFENCNSLTSVTIPKSVTWIDDAAFFGCSSLTSITIPEGVTRIGEAAFSGCSSLTGSIIIPEGEDTIRSSVFSGCSSLTSISISEGVRWINGKAFSGCNSLTSITIPDSVTSIGYKAFSGCNQLKDVYYAGTQDEKNAININDEDNDPLLNATWHYNSTGPGVLPDVEVSQTAKVRYFNSWDAEKKIAYWDNNVDGIGSAVTEETDLSFLDQVDSLVGHYVLVDTKARTDGKLDSDTLLSIRAVDTKYGKVTAIGKTNITIDGTTYPFGQNIDTSSLLPAENDSVVYFLCGNTLVGYDVLEDKEAVLDYWNTDSRELKLILGEGPSKNVVQATLSDAAAEGTLEYLGDTGYTNKTVYYKADQMNFVYEVRKRNVGGYYGKPLTPAEDEDIEARRKLQQYEADWEKAYQAFTEAAESAAEAPAKIDNTKEEATIEAEAKRMQEHDENPANRNSRYISFGANFENSYKKPCYLALARFFYKYTSQNVDLGSINTSDTMAGVKLINAIMASMNEKTATYKEGDLQIDIKVGGYGSANFGSLTCKSLRKGKNTSTDPYTAVICSTEKECKDAINDYMGELQDLSRNADYAFAKALQRDVLGKSLADLTNGYLQKIAKRLADNFEKKLARTLHEQLNICNVSGLFEILDDSYTLYTWGSKIDKLAKGDFTKAAEQILSLDFDKKTIKDAATQKAVSKLKNKADELAKAMLKYVNGTLVTDKNSWLYKIGIHCPVDVAIFDSNGNQIGFVSEEELWYNDGIEITEIGGSKQIVTFTDDELTLKITGTGYGVMNCTFEECDSDGNVKGRLNYYDISVEPQQEYTVTTVNDFENNADAMPIVTGDQKIAASEYIDVAQDACVNVSANPKSEDGVEGGKIYGYGTYAQGDAVILTAHPDEGYEFFCWTIGDDIVETKSIYEFTAREDVTITANFYKNDYVYVDVDTEEGGTAIGNARYHMGETATVIAEPDEGSTFAGWYNGETCVSEEETYEFVVNENTYLTAHWNTSVITPTATPTATPSSTPASTMKPAHSLILDWIKQWFHPSPKPTPTPTALPTPTSAPTEEPKPTVEPSSTPSATVKPMKPNHHWWWFWPFW